MLKDADTMSILITGATGFIGKRLVSKILEKNIYSRIFLLQRKSYNELLKTIAGDSTLTKIQNEGSEVESRKVGSLPSIKILKADLSDADQINGLREQITGTKVDHFVHLAASLAMFAPQKEIDRINVQGTIKLAKLAENLEASTFVFASSIEAVGPISPKDAPANELIKPQPVCNYGVSKLKAEIELSKMFGENSHLSPIILRFANVYGEGSSFLTIDIANEIRTKGLLYKSLPYIGNHKVHPVYVDDVVDAILLALSYKVRDKISANCSGKMVEELPSTNIESAKPASSLPTYFIAGEKSYTLEEIFREVNRVIKNKDFAIPQKSLDTLLKMKYVLTRDKVIGKGSLLSYFYGKPPRIDRDYSIEKARKELGFSPLVSFPRGLEIIFNKSSQNSL